MRICFVVHRYGASVAGGAETACRAYALALARRGHDVYVLTSCARNYTDWENAEPAGTTDDDGVTVHRLPTSQPRLVDRFSELSGRVLNGNYRAPFHLEREWMLAQGPLMPALVPWIEANAGDFDVVVFFTYLYYPTWAGLPAATGMAPVVFHPTAHDEAPFFLSLHRSTFAFADGLVFLTPEEGDLVHRVWHTRQPSDVIGIGVDVDAADAVTADAGDRFRAEHGLAADEPYVVCVGRIDPNKGTADLVDWYAHRSAATRDVRLVLVGDPATDLDLPDGVIRTGIVDDDAKRRAIAGALALASPSRFESFSIVLIEAWAQRRPVLVRAQTPVLAGQVRRSRGGIAYRGAAELDAAVELFVHDPETARRLGAHGRAYVDENYAWPRLLDRYEAFLGRMADPARRRSR
ncbi:MAG: glycosyltransferase family 4 protein [Acidimicrobiia bacterium]